jgi:hypothetical protein
MTDWTIDRYIAECAKRRELAIEQKGAAVFRDLIGGIEYRFEIVGLDPGDGHLVARSLDSAGAVVAGMLVHFGAPDNIGNRPRNAPKVTPPHSETGTALVGAALASGRKVG